MEGIREEDGGVEDRAVEHCFGVLWLRGGADSGRRRRVLPLRPHPTLRCRGNFYWVTVCFICSFADD